MLCPLIIVGDFPRQKYKNPYKLAVLHYINWVVLYCMCVGQYDIHESDRFSVNDRFHKRYLAHMYPLIPLY